MDLEAPLHSTNKNIFIIFLKENLIVALQGLPRSLCAPLQLVVRQIS